VRLVSTAAVATLCWVSAFSSTDPLYIVANDDMPPFVPSSVTVYTMGTGGALTVKARVETGGEGIGGGYFGMDRVAVHHQGQANCGYISDAGTGDIAVIDYQTLKRAGNFKGSKTDAGTSNGIGLAMNPKYLYASFTDSNTIGTFKVESGCKIKFVGDITVSGLHGGVIDGMAVHGNMMVTTYGDGSIQSFNIAGGVPVSNEDEQDSTGSRGGNTYPNGIEITQDGHFAIFGDTSVATVVEVSDLSSGRLAPTVVYHLGGSISSSNILLSPDESLLYISNTQGDRVSAAFFDKSTGKLSKGCASGRLKGYSTNWSYLAGLALHESTGTGGIVYVAEFGAPSSIGMVRVASAGGQCTLKEMLKSPVSDPNSPGLLSIGSFPAPPI
jgi:hypothetical protein